VGELRHRIRVRYSDCDPQGVLFNANYLTYFDIAMTELWRESIGPYEEAMARHGVDMVVAEARVRYLAPVRFDEEVELVAGELQLGNTSMTTRLRIEREGTRAAEGELRHVFVTYGTSEKTPIPEAVREALQPYVQAGASQPDPR
jgi:acyl-CoA thioester hydrolase